MKKLFVSALIVVFLGLLSSSVSYGKDVKVGIVDTYTGPPTAYTYDVLDGFKMAVAKINAKGGVLGKDRIHDPGRKVQA